MPSLPAAKGPSSALMSLGRRLHEEPPIASPDNEDFIIESVISDDVRAIGALDGQGGARCWCAGEDPDDSDRAATFCVMAGVQLWRNRATHVQACCAGMKVCIRFGDAVRASEALL
jgi:hypothetical protein